MKKTILTLALLVMAMTVGAQTLRVSFQKGEIHKYTTKTDYSIGIPMQGEKTGSTTASVAYTVSDATADGYVVEMRPLDFQTSGDVDILSQLSDTKILSYLNGTPVELKLDKNGVVTDILNSDKVLAAVSKATIDEINKQYAEHPEAEKVVPKAKALMAVNEQLTKENVLEQIRDNSVFSLNGKDLKANPEEDETFQEFIKVKSTYTVGQDGDKTVIGKKSVSNMTEDEVKAFLVKQIAKMTGGAVSSSDFDSMWSQMKMMGMTKLSFDLDGTSTFGTGAWLSNSNMNTSTKIMGASIKISATTTEG